MKKVYLINPPDADIESLHITKDMAGGFGFNAGSGVDLPSLELIYHALHLKEKGFQIEFYDFQVQIEKLNNFFETINENQNNIYLVLFTTPTLETDINFVKKIKEKDFQAEIYAKFGLKTEELLKKIFDSGVVNKVLCGETELIFEQIIENNDTRGTAYLENNNLVFGPSHIVEDLNQLPDFEDLSFLEIERYKYVLLDSEGGNTFTFQSSRGCPFQCSYYCPYPLLQGKKWRAMTAFKLFKNFKILFEKYNVKALLFRDATFSLDKERTLEFCNSLINENIKINWWCESRMNCLDQELLEKMSEAGCRGINLGVETGDEELLKTQGKVGGDIDQLIKIRNLAKENNIKLHFLMIIGLPDETKKSLYNSYKMVRKLKPESMGVTVITPYPGTPLYKEAIENNWIINKNFSEYSGNEAVMRTKYLRPSQLKHAQFLLQAAGFISRQKRFIYKFFDFGLQIYFWLWKLVKQF